MRCRIADYGVSKGKSATGRARGKDQNLFTAFTERIIYKASNLNSLDDFLARKFASTAAAGDGKVCFGR